MCHNDPFSQKKATKREISGDRGLSGGDGCANKM